jgi:hypothetical protein
MSDRRIAGGLFVLVFVAYAWFFGGGGWNQNAAFDLTRAIVEQHTFAIDAFTTSSRINTYDVAFHAKHVYANKAPGLSLLAVIPYSVLYAIERAVGIDVNSFDAMNLNLYVCGVAVCATSGALLIALFFLYGRRIGITPIRALAVALVLAFGTYLFAYSTVFFNHVPGALFLFWCFARLTLDPDRRPWIAGALGGAAVLSNYPLLIPVALIVVAAIALPGPRLRRFAWIAAGAAPFAIALLVYQAICFGSPLRTSVEATSDIFHTEGALFGVLGMPKLSVLYAITFSRFRGLFFLSPVLLFVFIGAAVMMRSRQRPRDLALAGGVVASLLLINMSFNNWDGGSAIGPRYILQIVPFLGVPMLYASGILRPLWILLGAISMLFNLAVTAVNPTPSRLVSDPIFRYTVPLLVTGRLPADVPPHPPFAWKLMLGRVSVNRLGADDLVPFHRHRPGSRESEWASFNLGELVAPGSVLSLIPIVIWIAGGSVLLATMPACFDARRRSSSRSS